MTRVGIRGRRVHFAGSADSKVDPSRLRYAHTLIRRLASNILSQGGGLIVTVGSEPLHEDDTTIPLIFDWTLLEALDECLNSGMVNWPKPQGLPVVVVGLPKWRKKVPENRKPLWKRVVSSKNVELVQIGSGLSIGGILREQQAALGDILIALGGGPGVQHLAQLYMSSRKPVIPFDLPLKGAKPGTAEILSTQVMETPKRFFEYSPCEEATAAYSLLSLRNELPEIREFSRSFFGFLSHLPRPRAFFVRLLNRKSSSFDAVEAFFRDVVDPVVRDAGYDRFEVGRDTTREPFLNVEIFQTLHYSSFVIADLTGLRPNCLIELGYTLGQGKKVIVTAQEDTRLPFDSAAIPCHFWSPSQADSERKSSFEEFMKKNINRRSLIG